MDLLFTFAYICRVIIRVVRVITDPIVDVFVTLVMVQYTGWQKILEGQTVLHPPSLLPSLEALTPFLQSSDHGDAQLGDISTLVGNHMSRGYQAYRTLCVHIAYSERMSDRIWTLLTGYGVGATSILIIAIAGEAGLGRISAAVSAQVKQHATFLKLSFFMALELLVFPVGIGMVIDACTVPLFAGASLVGRLRHLRAAPFGVLFVSWLVGTL